jgi:hypothetical protein
MHCSNKPSLIRFHDSVGLCISSFFAASKRFAVAAVPLSKKWVRCLPSVCLFWEAAYLFGKSNHWLDVTFHHWCTDQARKKEFRPPSHENWRLPFCILALRLMHHFFSMLDAGPSGSAQNPKTNDACCDKQQPRGSLAQWMKKSLKCPNASLCFDRRKLDYSVGWY